MAAKGGALPPLRAVGTPPAGSGGGALQTVSSLTPPPTLAGGQQRCTGTIQHWDSHPRQLWGYVMCDGPDGPLSSDDRSGSDARQMAGGQQHQQLRHHFRRTDILDPCPAQVRKGMLVEFRPGVNPPGGKHAGKPIALEVRFVGQ